LVQDAGLGGHDDLVGQQAVQLQQQGVGVLLVIRVRDGRSFSTSFLMRRSSGTMARSACASMAFRMAVR
jgi:hypothetical protein